MSDVVIRAENLGKKYRINHQRERQQYVSLRDEITHRAASLFRKPQLSTVNSQLSEDFWALKDVNFEIKQGEVVGIIGRNGAGKSTLLKILSRITEPTNGRIGIKGRVASLLEVGTGFHPELTGRENIYLNGAILGMSREEIKRKFDEIVAFAEVEQFLDTPVKRYSSGMYVRLAFAVAAHLEPEILIIDEVLAVGDAQFQRKCLGKMEDIGKGGRTVLFVSHNMAVMATLCSRAYLFYQGQILVNSEPTGVIAHYLESLGSGNHMSLDQLPHYGSGKAQITEVQFQHKDGAVNNLFLSGEPCYIRIKCQAIEFIRNVSYSIGIYDSTDRKLALLDSSVFDYSYSITPGTNKVECFLPIIPLLTGKYFVNVAITSGADLIDGVSRCAELTIEPGDFFGTAKLPSFGPFLIQHQWVE